MGIFYNFFCTCLLVWNISSKKKTLRVLSAMIRVKMRMQWKQRRGGPPRVGVGGKGAVEESFPETIDTWKIGRCHKTICI